jgi:hypothetical protein
MLRPCREAGPADQIINGTSATGLPGETSTYSYTDT